MLPFLKPILSGLLLLLAHAASQAGVLYCCNDERGKQVCSDLLPAACYGRAYREIGESGLVVRHVDAPLTAEQRAQRAAEEVRRKAEEAVQKEQKRKDLALLNTYSSVKDIEIMRQRAEQDVLAAIGSAEAKIATLREQRKKFENEAEFYRKKTLPPEIDKGLRGVDLEIRAQESIIEAKKKEMGVVRAKYDEDTRRFLELSRRPNGGRGER